MSTVIFIFLVAGIVFLALYHKPVSYSETELKKWFSSRLEQIEDHLEDDINKDINGEYAHAGKPWFEKRGEITYVLHDKNHSRLDVSDKNILQIQEIMDTDGYRKLAAKVLKLKLAIRLDENRVDGDGINTFNELDEYIDDYPRYYTVTISGW